MAVAWTATAAARQAANMARMSVPPRSSSSASLIHCRGLASSGEHHGAQKVNFWQDPMSPSKWKEEHFVIVSLTGWGLFLYGGYKFFTKGKKESKDKKIGEGAH